jgi:hypothetical protein
MRSGIPRGVEARRGSPRDASEYIEMYSARVFERARCGKASAKCGVVSSSIIDNR